MSVKLIAILYASPLDDRVLQVAGRLNEHGIEHRIYGGQWRGCGEALHMAHEAARMLDCTHILKLDAYDVLVLAGPDEILARFKDFGKPWVFNAEANCWPDGEKADQYPPCPTPWRFLNAGVYLAEREYLAETLNRWKADEVPLDVDDQRWFTERYLSEPGIITLDSRCRLFQSMFALTRAERNKWVGFDEGRTVCRNFVTGTKPLILHFNGITIHDNAF